MTRYIQYGSKQISYSLEYAERASLGITVTPETEVLVRAPIGAAIADIEVKLKKRASWILAQQSFFLGFHPRASDKRFVSGESHLYLGRQYRLKVVEGTKNSVHFNGRELLLTKRPRSSPKAILHLWYRMRAKELFAAIAEPFIQRFGKYGVGPEDLFIQAMPTRWGSCTASGKIILNSELIKASKKCVEYVIVHELCHLVHKHHTAAFFALQKAEMPDWEKWKEKLELLLA